ncbi:MAG: SDR family NAD(P)-dependent oxidoreductase [Anaerolineae bacterium]|nr:SDR family NAD(P)-dependent oxidoreductase [Anaerolineae bacterium]
MTVVVTGAAGHLGGNLVRALLARGAKVRALDYTRHWQALEGLEVERVQADVRDLDALRRAFAGADIVYHAAAVISLRSDDWPLLEAVNVIGTRNVVQACLDCRVRRLVHFSSIHALRQEPFGVPVDESSPLALSPSSPPYDRSKAAGEREVRLGIGRGLDAVILNPTGMIGPHDYAPSHFGQVLLALGQGRMPALVSSGFDWVDVRDVVSAALKAAEVAPPGARYLLSGHWVSMRALAILGEEITGADPPWFVCPLWLARAGASLADALARRRRGQPLFTGVSIRALRSNRYISHERAARELGYRPRPIRQTLADLYRWFEQAGRLKLLRAGGQG